MGNTFFEGQKWEDVLECLKSHRIPAEEIGPAIVYLAKPYDPERILAAKEIIATYLNHTDGWVRHEAMWFLTYWGGLKEYQPALIRALRKDPDLDNRSFAASCLGRLQAGLGDAEVVAALKCIVEDESLDQLLRLYAYGALLQVVKGISDLGYSPHDQELSDIDWAWVRSLS
jgi:hypothetical protein